MMDSPEKILYKEYGSQGGEDHLINSRSLQGSAYNAVHLHTFESRYRQTPNPSSGGESLPVLLYTGFSFMQGNSPCHNHNVFCTIFTYALINVR
ncbi:hypothetical protein [Xenorhabdus ehlersii]|nr:hypothetical protein [Xenorhabdus ehlersii]PHM22189.1 hypothetical protein Xehl_03864 [Xenorhabdus ehlersii]